MDICTRLRVVKVTKYKSFREMIEANGLENVLPGVLTVDDGEEVYRKWYSKKLEDEFGVVGIEIEVIN